ncbi:DUF4097 family beta strand repeat-containing protein [Salinactinospora qingdaonensis]|uniref:DUF4097 domain-containing protein n=1 Tax=Salinactinospora qingdaonensis TaxID=702744 RepID=A0ABP7G0I6_9ACTN
MTFTSRGLYATSSKIPRRRRYGWLAFGAAVAVLAVLLGGVNALGAIPVAVEGRNDSFEGVHEIVIDNATVGEVTVTGTDDGAVTVQRELQRAVTATPEESLAADGGTLRAEATCTGGWLFLGSSCAIDYEIRVPADADIAIDARTSTGDITVTSVRGDITAASSTGELRFEEVTAALDLETSTGEVEASGSGESATVTSSTGSVDLADFTADRFDVRTSTGDIAIGGGFTEVELQTSTGEATIETGETFDNITANTGTGDLEIEVPEGAYHVTGDSTSGDREVDVSTDAAAAASIDATTTTGEVTIEAD